MQQLQFIYHLNSKKNEETEMLRISLIILLFLSLNGKTIYSQSWLNDLSNRASRIYSETKREFRHYKQKIREDYNYNRKRITGGLSDSYSKWERNVKKYGEKVQSELKEIYENPYEIDKYSRLSKKTLKSGTITVLRNIPIYDPETHSVVSFDTYSKNLVKNLVGNNYSDFTNDPIAVTVGIMMDDDYLLKAKIIPTKNGAISINDMQTYGYSTKQINSIYSDYWQLKKEFRNGNPNFNTHFASFTRRLGTIKKHTSFNLGDFSSKVINLNKNLVRTLRFDYNMEKEPAEILSIAVFILITFFIIILLWKIIKLPVILIKKITS